MKKTIMTACSMMVLTALLTACGSNNRKGLALLPSIKGQKGFTHPRISTYGKGTTQCLFICPSHQAYDKALEHKASSLTIKDYLK